jgi:hypothetical protein
MTEKQISRVLCSVTQKLQTGLISFEMRISAVFNTIEVRLSSFEILANIYLFPYYHNITDLKSMEISNLSGSFYAFCPAYSSTIRVITLVAATMLSRGIYSNFP